MCGPAALVIAATAMTAAGSVVSGIQAKQQGDYQAQVADNNAQLAAQARREAIDKGTQDQIREDRHAAQLQGAQHVAMAGSGVDTTFGTAADLASDSALIGSENRQTIATNTDRAAQGYAIDAMNDRTQATAAKMKGNSALINGLFSAGGTVLSGASQVSKVNMANKYGYNSGAGAYGISGSDGVY